MEKKENTNKDTQKWKEELLQEGRIDEQSQSPFEKVQQNNGNERSVEEESEAEQQLKEASSERD